MPLIWRRGENPYRLSYFSLLELGPSAPPNKIAPTRQNLFPKVRRGTHVIAGRTITEPEIIEAETGLLNNKIRPWEMLLAHPEPGQDSKRLRQICKAIKAEALPPPTPPTPRLVNLQGLARFLPEPRPEEITLPAWEELGIAGPESPEDRRLDIQFDL